MTQLYERLPYASHFLCSDCKNLDLENQLYLGIANLFLMYLDDLHFQ